MMIFLTNPKVSLVYPLTSEFHEPSESAPQSGLEWDQQVVLQIAGWCGRSMYLY